MQAICKTCGHEVCEGNEVIANIGYEDEEIVCKHYAEKNLHQCACCGEWFGEEHVIRTEWDEYFCTECNEGLD